MASSGTTSIAIFASYLAMVTSLSAFLVTTLLRRFASVTRSSAAQLESRRLALFVLLALLSIGATWYYMFQFFGFSYHDWLSRNHPTLVRNPDASAVSWMARARQYVLPNLTEAQAITKVRHLRIGSVTVTRDLLAAWLVDTRLFHQAWEGTCSSWPRYWWSQQIFGLTTLWSFFLGWHRKRGAIPLTPLFMVLGQFVAISYAMNLFFLAVLLTPASEPTAGEKVTSTATSEDSSLSKVPWIVLGSTVGSVILLPIATGTSYFMPILIVPHVLLLLPTFSIGLTRTSTHNVLRAALYAFLIVQMLTTVIIFTLSEPNKPIVSLIGGIRYATTFQDKLRHPVSTSTNAQMMSAKVAFVVKTLYQLLAIYFGFLGRQLALAFQFSIAAIRTSIAEVMRNPLHITIFPKALLIAMQHRKDMLQAALFANPAVTSVGFDAILTWISGLAWIATARSVKEGVMGIE